jgi:hypothetical protein
MEDGATFALAPVSRNYSVTTYRRTNVHCLQRAYRKRTNGIPEATPVGRVRNVAARPMLRQYRAAVTTVISEVRQTIRRHRHAQVNYWQFALQLVWQLSCSS